MIPGNLFLGTRVRLTAVEPGDIPAITRWYRDGHFMRLYDADAAMPKTEREVTDTITGQQKSKTAFVFAIRPLERDDLVGYIELDGILWSQGTGWMSIAIGDEPQRGQGYGAEALRLLLDFAFGELNLRRVQLTVFSYNTAAIALYEKIGFMREGVFREFVYRDGQTHDMILYGLLRREWEVQRDA
jgi:RimJ/RimL family protein N-acetyltransferase